MRLVEIYPMVYGKGCFKVYLGLYLQKSDFWGEKVEILGIKMGFSRKRPERKWKNFTKRCILARRNYSISFIPLNNLLGCLKSIYNFWKNLFGRFWGGRRLKSKKLYQPFFVRLAILFRLCYLRISNFSKMAALEPKNWKFWWGGLPPSERLWRWSPRPLHTL